MSDILRPDGRPVDQPVVRIDAVEFPLPEPMKESHALEFMQRFCCQEQRVPGAGVVRTPVMTPSALLVAIEVANALEKRDEQIDGLAAAGESVVDLMKEQLRRIEILENQVEGLQQQLGNNK